MGKACILFGVDPPPLNPPSGAPPPDKKGTNLLLYQTGIYLHTNQDIKLKCCRVTGQKLRYGRPCTSDLPGTHNWLAQSKIASILQNSTMYLMLAHSWKFGDNCCSIGLNHPAACTRACVPLAFGIIHRPPLLPNLLKKGGNRLGLS